MTETGMLIIRLVVNFLIDRLIIDLFTKKYRAFTCKFFCCLFTITEDSARFLDILEPKWLSN